jgi:hypothetical protein
MKTKKIRRWVLVAAALVLVATAGVAAWGLDDDAPTTYRAGTIVPASYQNLDAAVCTMTLSTSVDGDQVSITWQLDSNRPGGTLELRTAPGDDLLQTIVLDDTGAAASTVSTSVPAVSTWLTAWISDGDERGGCASVQFA